VGVAVLIAAFLIAARLHYAAMPELKATTEAAERPNCMVIIPARDEAQIVGEAVRSFPHDTVIVVDDFSDDATADVARKAGAGVLQAPDLARGAMGKSNACAGGARVLTLKWILFADADVRVAPGFLNAIVAFAEAQSLALVSVYLEPEADWFGAGLTLPFAVALYFCGVRPRANLQAGFNGQCILVRRDAYEFVGGHSAVLTSRIEDVKLAALAERHRLKIATVRAPALGRVRFRQLHRTIRRSGARFMMLSPWIGVAILIAAVTLALWLPAFVWLLLDGEFLAATAFAILPMALAWGWYRSWRVIAAPVAIYFLFPAILAGLMAALTGRRVAWKKRTI
jgi:glycosyltransferase involved in cell wall biosynthesis